MTHTTISLDLDGATILKKFEDAKAVIREAEKVKAEADKALRALLGDAKSATIAGVTVLTVSDVRERVTVSAKDLKEADEALYNALSKVTEYTVLMTA